MKSQEKTINILAIESSCDETAASVVQVEDIELAKRKPVILSNVIASQIELHAQFGGVFPEQASRMHAEKIIPVIEQTLKEANLYDPQDKLKNIDLIAVTNGPGLIGSLLIGVNAAKTLAFSEKKPIIPINHWLGHIYSNFSTEPYPQFPALILIVSGGHTGLVLMEDYDKVRTLGETLDDAAGEAFDKVSNLLGLGYPGGPAISKAAISGEKTVFNFPRAMTDRKDYNFSFSGLKTAVLNEVKKLGDLSEEQKSNIAASFQQTVVDILINKTMRTAEEYQPKSICLCGGVAANKELREQLKVKVEALKNVSYHIPPFNLSTDNAAMIGLAAAFMDTSKYTTFDKVNADANLPL